MLSTHDDKVELPAEWEPQSATLLVWPHRESDWKENITQIENTYLEICKAISPYQKIIIVCRDLLHKHKINSTLNSNNLAEDSFILANCNYNDTWCRDYGPLIVRNDGTLEARDFVFNGWGNKFIADQDNQVTQQLYTQGVFDSLELNSYDFVLEGGSIDSDGHGTLLTTSNCLLKRHPDKNKNQLEQLLKVYLGAKAILWIEQSKLIGDDTDGHIDMLARFTDRETIVYSSCNDKSNPNYNALHKIKFELTHFKQINGHHYQLIPIEVPEPKIHKEKILPASYMNFLIINQAVLVPTYGDIQDKLALETLNQCFPDRNIIGINANELIKQHGSLHCATLQIPAGAIH